MRKYLVVLPGAWCAAFAASCGSSDGEVAVIDVVETVDFFDPCVFDEDCPLPTDCHDVAIDYGDVVVEDSFCTVECFDDFDCPVDGVCVDAASGPPLCYEPCIDDFDCPDGFGCVEEIGDFVFTPTCIPI